MHRIRLELSSLKRRYVLVKKKEITAVGIRRADHTTPTILKKVTNFSNKRGRSVGVVRSRSKATKLLVIIIIIKACVCHILKAFPNIHVNKIQKYKTKLSLYLAM
jgi:hypothetical protein